MAMHTNYCDRLTYVRVVHGGMASASLFTGQGSPQAGMIILCPTDQSTLWFHQSAPTEVLTVVRLAAWPHSSTLAA
jgi:hypothetical protein